MSSLQELSVSTDRSNIMALIGVSDSVDSNQRLEDVYKLFLSNKCEFMAVVQEGKFRGICSCSKISMILGSRFGFSIYSKQKIDNFLLNNAVVLDIRSELSEILNIVFSRREDCFYDDIAITEENGDFVGLIQVRSLVMYQHRLLTNKLLLVESHESELQNKNQILENLTSEIKETNKELSMARDKALEATRLKSEFLASMSHEIRTPMNGILGMINLMSETVLSPEQQYYSETVRNSAESLLRIINDILDFSKIEAGKFEIQCHEMSISDLIRSSVEIFWNKAFSKNLDFRCEVDPDMPDKVLGDSVRIRQVLLNLVGNAIKFTSEGHVRVYAKLKKLEAHTVTLYVEVEDTGVGIDQKVQGKLFTPFTQADSSTTRRHGGTGLGLSISKHLCELMDGRIGFQSEKDKGSTFWFELPLRVTMAHKQAIRKEFSSNPPAIFLCLENAKTDNLLASQLRSVGLNVYTDNRCDEVFNQLKAIPLQSKYIFLIDITQHTEKAFLTIRKIRENARYKEAIIIIITQIGLPVQQELMDEYSIYKYIYKPMHINEIVDVLLAIQESGIRSNTLPNMKKVDRDTDKLEKKSLKVLIVEDTVTNQAVARIMIQKQGHKAMIASNGFEALKMISENTFDCVFMDCMMPELDGYETTRRIRAGECGPENKSIPIIAMTANAMEGDREKCLDSGMDDYITKPIRKKDLCDALSCV